MPDINALLEIRNLTVSFKTEAGKVTVVNDVSYETYPGRTLAVVGESGCGKSVTAMSILQLIPTPPGKYETGNINFRGIDLLTMNDKRMRDIRGNEIAMIFQEPMTSLNPVYTVGEQIAEAVRLHLKLNKADAITHAVDMLRQVGISDPHKRVNEYPHQLSGGMRQRVMIAMALSCNPKLLIADEPTTALDVTIQAQILDLIKDLQKQKNMSVILITHDLGVVAENADDVAVMYASKIVEKSDVRTIFQKPLHPYTCGLLNSLPKLNEKMDRLEVIPGSVPDPLDFPVGCKFNTRCQVCQGDKRCFESEPPLVEIEPGHFCACWKVEK